MTMLRVTILVLMAVASLIAVAVEDQIGKLDRVSTGMVDLSLRINDDIRAGLLHRPVAAESDLKTLVSSGVMDGFRDSQSATLSLCIISSGGGMFEVTSQDFPGQVSALSRFGATVPLQVGFGADGSESVKHRASETGCSQNAVVPVTVRLKAQTSPEAGRVHGRLKLLVKSE